MQTKKIHSSSSCSSSPLQKGDYRGIFPRNSKGFTLVELIVVITILAILATIAFISISGYSTNARNSSRASDVKTIEKSLQIYSTRNNIYPLPENYTTVEYSGDEVYFQGTFGSSPYKELGNLSNVPVDPLTKTEYIYSTTYNRMQYEILALYEGEIVMTTPQPSPYQGEGVAANILNQANAAETFKPKVNGTYNKIFVKTRFFYIPLPSIINSQVTSGLGIFELDLNNIKSQIITNGKNIPEVGAQIVQSTGGLDISLSVYEGNITNNSSDSDKQALAQAIQGAYSGSLDLSTHIIYANILNQTDLVALVDSIVLGNGANNTVVQTTTNYSCNTTLPSCDGISCELTYEPTSENQVWTKDATSCGFACTGGYDGDNCEIAPNPYASCTGQNTPTPFSATTTYPGCDTADIIVCSGNQTGYTISACNVGATTAGTDWTNSNTIGKHFQWGRNDGFDYNGGATPTTTTTLYTGTFHVEGGIDLSGNATYSDKFIIASIAYSYNWLSKTGETIDPSWGQGPCPTGYYIPSQTEWSGIVTAGQWGSNGANMQTALNLPCAGRRDWDDGSFNGGGSGGGYWSSSPYGTYAYFLYFNSSSISPSSSLNRAYGFSVRCFKN